MKDKRIKEAIIKEESYRAEYLKLLRNYLLDESNGEAFNAYRKTRDEYNLQISLTDIAFDDEEITDRAFFREINEPREKHLVAVRFLRAEHRAKTLAGVIYDAQLAVGVATRDLQKSQAAYNEAHADLVRLYLLPKI